MSLTVEAFDNQDLLTLPGGGNLPASRPSIPNNSATDQADSMQGQADKEAQRVAFRVGESENIVVETGLYNLTQGAAPALAHLGTDQVASWPLVLLENPEAEQETPQ